jgi:preprotein translocase SecF subunit
VYHRFHINFIGRKWLWFGISGGIILVGLIAVLLGGLHWGVEFQGGNQYDVRFKTTPTVAEVRASLDKLKLGEATIQQVGTKNEYLIRTARLSASTRTEVTAALKKDFKVTDISTRDIGPGWGKQVTDGAVKALIASLLILLLYISIRFEFKMAVAALLALVHDALIVIGVYAAVGLLETKLGLTWIPTEITPNTVAALLTILGFSLYDTIVVFHRIKENTELIAKRTYSMMANDSINQVLMRSVNTSVTALIPVTVLLLFGGQTLKDFAFAMFVGLISGAYSSIFIASPILAMWKETEERYSLIRARLASAPQAKKQEATRSDSTEASSDVDSLESAETPAPKPQLTAAQKAKKKKKKKKR